MGRECEGYANLWATPLSTSTAPFQRGISKPKRRKILESRGKDETQRLSELYNEDEASFARHPTPESIYTPDSVDSHTSDGLGGTMTIVSDVEHSPVYSICRSPPIFQASDAYYLQYHAELGSQLLSNLEFQRNNPLKEVLIPRAMSSPLFLNALCTLSAGHMSNRASSNKDTLRKAELTYYGKTLSGVRKALAALPQETASSPAYIASVEELISTVASLCKYEAVRGSVRSWRGHLEALQRLVNSCGGLINLDRGIADWLSGL